jgi:hypothetical protein
LDHLGICRIPGIRPYWISGREICYPAGYRISKKAGLSGRISGASLLFIAFSNETVIIVQLEDYSKAAVSFYLDVKYFFGLIFGTFVA